MNVILELNVPDVIRSLANNNQDPNFNSALDLAYARQATSNRDFIDLFVEEYKRLDPGVRLAAIFSTFDSKDRITPQSSDAQVVAVIKEDLKSAIDNSFNVLRSRIDRFGVVSPNIQRLETTGRILVELPGVKEPERVRKLLQGSANLEFWETFDLPSIYQQLITADEVLAKIIKTDNVVEEATSDEPVETTTQTDEVIETESISSEIESLLAELEGNENAGTQSEDMSIEEYEKSHPLFSKLQLNIDNSGR
jgi:SecD/SecF fusion protein